MSSLILFARRLIPKTYRSRYCRLHIWWPGVASVVFGDTTTNNRFALAIHRRAVIRWRYSRV